MNKICLLLGLYILLSVKLLEAQTFIDFNIIKSEFSESKRNHIVQPKTIELDSKLSAKYDSCYVYALYTIDDLNLLSTEIRKVKCFCKNGNEESFLRNKHEKRSGYPIFIAKLLARIKDHIDSPIIIVNDSKTPNSGNIYLGAIIIKFKD